MQHVYSFCGSRLHLVLEEKIAEGYNRTTDAFIAEQLRFKKENGRPWTPGEDLIVDVSKEDMQSYIAVGRVIDLLVETNGGELAITEEDMTSDHLIRV